PTAAAIGGKSSLLQAVASPGGTASATLLGTTDYAYGDPATLPAWGSFDMSTVSSGAVGVYGAVFDKRYVDVVPNQNALGTTHGVVTRYDTTGSFTGPSSWAYFDMSTVNTLAKGYEGAVFDGRYVYFSPGPFGSLVATYDTTKSFGSSGSWTFF